MQDESFLWRTKEFDARTTALTVQPPKKRRHNSWESRLLRQKEKQRNGPASPRSSPVERGKGVRIQVEQGAIFSWRLAAGPVPDGSHPRSTTLCPNVSHARTRGRGDISLDMLCSACTYIRRWLIESKGRGRYKVCRPPRRDTHTLPVRTSRGRRVRVLTFILSPSIHPRCPRANNLGTGEEAAPNFALACVEMVGDNCTLLCLDPEDRYYLHVSLFWQFPARFSLSFEDCRISWKCRRDSGYLLCEQLLSRKQRKWQKYRMVLSMVVCNVMFTWVKFFIKIKRLI